MQIDVEKKKKNNVGGHIFVSKSPKILVYHMTIAFVGAFT
jgi:hypothetical protein